MTTRSEAVAVARRYTRWPHGYCAAFVQKVYGHGWVGSSALDAWHRATHKHTSYPPPAGVPVYWDAKGRNPYGHIAVSLGGGKVRSSDFPRSGAVGTVDIRWIERNWPNTGRYLGWSDDIAGVIIGGAPSGSSPAPAKPTVSDTIRRFGMFIAHSQHNKDHKFLVGPTSVRKLEAQTYHNLRDLGVPVVNKAISDESIRDLSDSTTAAGGVAGPGVDTKRGPG